MQVKSSCCSAVDKIENFSQYFFLNFFHYYSVFSTGQGVSNFVVVVIVSLTLNVIVDHASEHWRGRGQFLFVRLILSGPRVENDVWGEKTVTQVLLTCRTW